MPRILVAGANGMLGRDLQTVLGERDVTALGRAALDVTDLDAVVAASAGHDVIINASAYTKVDDAENYEDEAHAVNATGAANLATAAAKHGARLIQVSTDYVFSGDATSPYPEDSAIAPQNAYGRTKAEGERLAVSNNPDATLIVRTAWLYGAHGPNFVKTMLKLAADRDTLSVVDDQVGQPTWTLDLARQIVALVDADAPAGAYHGTNGGQTSWFGFAREIFRLSGLDPERVKATDSASFVRPAARPAYSVLGHDGWAKTGITPMREWQAALEDALASGVATTP